MIQIRLVETHHRKQSKDAGHNLKKLWLVSTADLMAVIATDLTTLLKGNEDMADSTNTKPRRKHTLFGIIDLPEGVWNRVFYLAPVAFALLWGVSWIAIHAHQARGFTHPLFQCLALTENVIALLLRRRKPIGTLAGILVVYILVDLEPVLLVPVLFSLFTVTAVGTRWVTVGAIGATTLLIMATPFIHKDSIDLFTYSFLHLTAIGLVAAAGLSWRLWQKRSMR